MRAGWVLVAVLLLAGVGFQKRETLAALLRPAFEAAASSDAASRPDLHREPRKCVDAQGRVLYTTDPQCPRGQREHAISAAPPTVVAAPPPAAASAAASVAMPLDRIDKALQR